jgi:hypothetical protein
VLAQSHSLNNAQKQINFTVYGHLSMVSSVLQFDNILSVFFNYYPINVYIINKCFGTLESFACDPLPPKTKVGNYCKTV